LKFGDGYDLDFVLLVLLSVICYPYLIIGLVVVFWSTHGRFWSKVCPRLVIVWRDIDTDICNYIELCHFFQIITGVQY